MRTVRLLLLIGVPVALLALVAVALPGLRGLTVGSPVPTAEVQQGEFVRKVEAEGNLEAATATVLTAPPNMEGPARIAWLAPDGSRVDEGEVVIRFDPTEAEKNLREGTAGRASAQSKIKQKKLEDGVKLENLELDAGMAQRELEYSREFQSKDAEVFSRAKIIESEIDEELATERQAHAQQTRTVTEELSTVELDLLAIERKKAELMIQRAEQRLQSLEVTAPHGGIFVLKEQWGQIPEVGSMVWTGQQVAELPQLDEMEGKVYVLEADAGGLEAGLEARVTLDAHPGREYTATVKQVDALPTPRHRGVPVQYFTAKLEFDETDGERMKPGQRIRAVLFLERLDDVLTVPREALFEKEGKKIVYRGSGGDFEPVEVTPGPMALGRVVVEQGLEAGDRVALRDPTRAVDEEQPAEGAPAASPAATAGALR